MSRFVFSEKRKAISFFAQVSQTRPNVPPTGGMWLGTCVQGKVIGSIRAVEVVYLYSLRAFYHIAGEADPRHLRKVLDMFFNTSLNQGAVR